jgi:hypothetical protein
VARTRALVGLQHRHPRRSIAVPEAPRERILAEKDPALLERWIEEAVVAASLAELLAEPS